MQQPLISVVTVVYNAERIIEETIKSILSQEYDNMEFIVVNGNSTDGTNAIIEKYHNRISCYINEPDHGIYDAMNKGIKASTGDWLCFINAGDVFYSNTILKDVFCRDFPPQVGLIYGDVEMTFKGEESFIKNNSALPPDTVQINLCHQATFTKGDIIRKLSFDLRYKVAADANLFTQVKEKGYSFKYVPVAIARYEAGEGFSHKQVWTIFKEYSAIQHLTWQKIAWWKYFFKTIIRVTAAKILPVKLYNELYAKRIRSVNNKRIESV